MALGFIFLVITIFALFGTVREFKRRNLFGGGYALLSFLVFGWFSVMSIYASIWGNGAVSGE
ncbi:MAG TPA: DUF2759 domain-containing protein [Bacillales bacterium]|nr:DUF2759 domain-containing protein [Bacillales bacterium]